MQSKGRNGECPLWESLIFDRYDSENTLAKLEIRLPEGELQAGGVRCTTWRAEVVTRLWIVHSTLVTAARRVCAQSGAREPEVPIYRKLPPPGRYSRQGRFLASLSATENSTYLSDIFLSLLVDRTPSIRSAEYP